MLIVCPKSGRKSSELYVCDYTNYGGTIETILENFANLAKKIILFLKKKHKHFY